MLIKDIMGKLQSKLYSRIFLIHSSLLAIVLSSQKSREIILGLESNFFKDAGPSKLLFIVIIFFVFSMFAYILPMSLEFFDKLSWDKRKYFSVIPSLSFLIYIVIPTYYKYFSGEVMFTDLAYSVEFLVDKSVQNVSDKSLVYPSSFLWIRNFNLPLDGINLVLFLSILATITFMICIIHFSMKLRGSSALIFAVLLVSPPIKWLFESQNLDLFIIIALYFCSIVYLNNFGIRNSIGIFILTLIALIKLYTVPVLFYLFFLTKSRFCRIQIVVSLCFLIPVLYTDTGKILGLLPIGADNNAIGIRILFYFLGFDRNLLSMLSIIAGIIIFVIVFVFISLRKSDVIHKVPISSNIYMFSVIIFALSMITTSSFPYRMIFLLFVIPLLFNRANSSFDTVIASYAFVAFFCYTRSLGLIQNLFLLPILIASIYSVMFLLLKNYQNQK